MAGIITPGQLSQPRIVTIEELRSKLLPLCLGWGWAEDAIHDLWKMGAPIPQAPDQPERRILLPHKFQQWWAEIQQRMGIETPGPTIYAQATRFMRTGAGDTRRH